MFLQKICDHVNKDLNAYYWKHNLHQQLCYYYFAGEIPQLSHIEADLSSLEPGFVSSKEVCLSSEEGYLSSKGLLVLRRFVGPPKVCWSSEESYLTSKEVGLSSEEGYLSSEEVCLSSEEGYLSSEEVGLSSEEGYFSSEEVSLSSE